MLDITYPPIILAGKTWFKLMDFRFQLTGTEHIPREGGALLAFNHISYVDFILGGYAAVPSKRLVRFMAKRETFDHPLTGPIMRSLHHIKVDRAEGTSSAAEAVRYLRDGEVVGIFPEATISRSFQIKDVKTGAVRIAAEAGVPLIPVVLWGTQRLKTKDHESDLSRHKTIAVTVGAPLHPTGENAAAETAELKAVMEQMLDATIKAYPSDEQPPGSWWLPAAYGGSAPTPERAKELDREETAARIAVRRAKAAAKKR
jgi:1-acyl-sn-glycerol-3-phosphate acyltransferase